MKHQQSPAVAPGYVLDLTADGSSDSATRATLKIIGKGSMANELCRKLQPGILELPGCRDLKQTDKVTGCFLDERRAIENAFKSETKKFTDKTDPYFSFFKNAAWYDLNVMQLEKISGFLKYHYKDFSVETMRTILLNNIDSNMLRNISNEKYLSSQQYIWMIGQGNQYLFYNVRLEHLNDSIQPTFKDYLVKIDQIFSGRIRSYYLKTFLNLNVGTEGSYENFMTKKDIVLAYADKIENQQWKKNLVEYVAAREAELVKTKIGKPAPFFELRDSSGRVHRLSDFKGKVVLLDFWASWCGPCRYEIPYLKKLHLIYKNKEVVFVSIAVRDSDRAWRRAMKEDQSPWLNLWGEGSIEGDYATSAIPKFVVIDAKGNVFDFAADAPSDADKLKNTIDNALQLNQQNKETIDK